MFRIAINLTYDGAGFYGWQRQTKHSPTIQGLLEEKLSKLFNTHIRVVGAGRTDRGAHALSQWAHADVPVDPATMKLHYRLNRLTPETLRINAVYSVPKTFHAQRSARKKKYIYKVDNGALPDPIKLHHAHHVRQPLDVDLLNRMAEMITGKQDFKSFQSSGTDVETSVRTVFSARWTRRGDILTFAIVGDGFLKQMVRNIVGTMLWCAEQPNPEQSFKTIVDCLDRRKAKNPAPAHGLFLKWVRYDAGLSIDKNIQRL